MRSGPIPAARLKPALVALERLLGARLTTEEEARVLHAKDESHHAAQPPHAVAFPRSTEEVARIVRICARQRVPIVPYGTGTAVEGGVVAVHGGVCVDLSRMNRILRLSPRDMDVTVQAGVTRKQLNRHLADGGSGLFFPVDPGADASLGGMAATRASGLSAVRYGTMRENVLGLVAVTADGCAVRTGSRARKSAAGYDLTHLLVGSEGTLGIITELTLRLARVPEAMAAAVCAFSGAEAAVDTVIEVMSKAVPMARIELLDAVQMGAINRYSGLPYKAAPTLFFEFHGSTAAVVEQSEAVGAIAARHGGEDFRWATEAKERERLWQARYDSYYASRALRPGAVGYVTDVCVPISQLAAAIVRTREALQETELPAPLYGHVGDGNFHVVFLIDPGSTTELQEARALGRRIVDIALELGGTCSGEHGIGLGKIDALAQEHGEGTAVMKAIKNALDPHHIMNPGKVLATP